MMKALFYLSLLLVLLSCLKKSQASFQTFDMSYHLSSTSICKRPSGFKNKLRTTAVLEVVHRHSPCVQTDKKRHTRLPSVDNILANDQLRVKYIQARIVKPVDSININKDPNKSCRDIKRAQLPARSGVPLHTANYIVTIELGTPERNLSLVFDTGSSLTWTQCKPCIQCYQQKDPVFDPSTSTTFSNISCDSDYCPQYYDSSFSCDQDMCAYDIGYADGSSSSGLLSKDKLTLTPTNVIQSFLFGCSQDSDGIFGLTDGMLGLDRDPLSFVSQTADIYKKYFSTCLPSTINSTGFLAFGKRDDDDDAKMIFTDLVPTPPGVKPTYYFIEITAISVGGTQLSIKRSVFRMTPTVIDSGTVITRLSQAAYMTMSKEFKKQMNKLNYTSAKPYSMFDTCFYIPRHTATVPPVSFTFKGNATINLDASGILYPINPTYACLAFAGNSDLNEDLAIFGNTQQMKFEVAYDVAGNKLGFAYNPSCQ